MKQALNVIGRVLILSFIVSLGFYSCSPTKDEILEKALSVKETAYKKLKEKDYNGAIKAYTELLQFDHPEIEYEKAYLNRGGIYTHLGQYDKALKDLSEAEKILISKKNPDLIALLYLRYGKLYLVNRNYELSNHYYKKGSELEEIKESYRMDFYYRLANNYKLVGNDSCFIYYRKVYENKKDTSPRIYSNNLGAICGAYIKIESDTIEKGLSSMDSVRFYCEEYFKVIEEKENKPYLSSYYLKKSKYYCPLPQSRTRLKLEN